MRPSSLAWLLLAWPLASLGACSEGSDQATNEPSPRAGRGGNQAKGGAASSGTSGQGGSSAGAGGASSAGGATPAGPGGSASGGGAQAGAPGGGQATGGAAGQPGAGTGGAPPPPCTTRVSYGDRWIKPDNHPASHDDTAGEVTWDGVCHDDGSNSYAELSNGWKPYFSGRSACEIALDTRHCPGAPTACTTRITYGPSWLHGPDHPAQYDDVGERVYWNHACSGGDPSSATLSNGWAPHFSGPDACAISLRYQQCGGLYQNPVFPQDCPDPGVLRDGDQYVMTCTGGDGGGLYVIRTSPDLVHWTPAGHIFPPGTQPTWAVGKFWAPEIHRVGDHYVAYFSAEHADGKLSLGAATGPTALGPFQDLGQPLVHEGASMIDVHEFDDAQGNHYLVWKEDGNAVGKPTPIYGQQLDAAGTALVGSRTTLISNTLGWEGKVVEGPWVVHHGGFYYLFYSGNAYYNGTYAVGVARASDPLGPYQKLGAPILTSSSAWIGPGHCSVVDTPHGTTAMIYHAWQAGHVNGPGDGRLLLIDSVRWGDWPSLPASPSLTSRPVP